LNWIEDEENMMENRRRRECWEMCAGEYKDMFGVEGRLVEGE